MLLSYDTDAAATYLQLPGYDPDRAAMTLEVLKGTLTIDVDEEGQPIGVEALRPPAEIDQAIFDAIAERCPTLPMHTVRAVCSGERLTTGSPAASTRTLDRSA